VIEESEMEKPLVELKGVSRKYGRVKALDQLTFTLGPGICYGLIGRNGAGKSTMLRIIMGLLRPDLGTVRLFDGDPIQDAERVKLHVGYLAEDQEFPPVLSPAELFRFLAACYPSWDSDFAQSLVDRFKIPVNRSIFKLSKGQQRQAALVGAVAHRPQLLILDEPGGGLDPVVRREFLEEVIELLGGEGTSVLFSSHHLQEVERLATRVGILHEGRIVLEDDLDHLKEGSCRILAELSDGDGDRIRAALQGCVHVRRLDDAWSLTMLCSEPEAKERVARTLGGRVRETRSLSLEDLFVSLVG
jgi:ABC-2 type transport system ATP-binding protein